MASDRSAAAPTEQGGAQPFQTSESSQSNTHHHNPTTATTPQRPIHNLTSSSLDSDDGKGPLQHKDSTTTPHRMSSDSQRRLKGPGRLPPMSASFTTHRSPTAGTPDTPKTQTGSSPPKFITSPPGDHISPPLATSSSSSSSSSHPSNAEPPAAASPFANVPLNSPWARLAATSGVPTPSLEGPGGPVHSPFGPAQSSPLSMPFGSDQARSISPHLGAPFELLNLDGKSGGGQAPMGWPGTEMPSQTPSANTANMADPFSSIPAPVGSAAAAAANPKFTHANQGGPMNLDVSHSRDRPGFDFLAAKLAKRRGSKSSGPSGLSQSSFRASTGSGENSPSQEQGHSTSSPSKPPAKSSSGSFGPISGPGRPLRNHSGSSASSFKLNLPGRPDQPRAEGSNASGSSSAKIIVPQPISPQQLVPLLNRIEKQVLVLDLRAPSGYIESHLPGSLSLPVPSTLVKRPAFTLDKLAGMLAPKPANIVSHFEERDTIVIIDYDSTVAAPGSTIVGLASKFGSVPDKGDWKGDIFFVKGGFSACQDLDEIDMESGRDESDEDEKMDTDTAMKSPGGSDAKGGPRMVGRLDRKAFMGGKLFLS